MKKKWQNSNGFTLAELLIVVAIIAVLVAISIPIFTTQLEKAREATDLSDVRSAYAEVMMAAITDDTTATYSKDPTQTIHKSNGLYSVYVSPLHQEQNDWQGTMDLNVGGVSSSDRVHWIGIPQAKGSCEVSYKPQEEAVYFNWLGRNNAGGSADTGNSGNNSGNNGTTGGGSTPAPAPNPGTDSGTTGGDNQGNAGGNTDSSDNNQGNTNPGGNTGGNNNQGNTGNNTGTTDNNQGNTNGTNTPSSGKNDTENSVVSTLKDLNSGDWPPNVENTSCTIHLKTGQVVFFDNNYYIWNGGDYSYMFLNNTSTNTNQYATPTSQMYEWMFIKVTDKDVHTSGSIVNKKLTISNVSYGDLYKDADGNVFICKSSWSNTYDAPPSEGDSNWVKILSEQPTDWYSYTRVNN